MSCEFMLLKDVDADGKLEFLFKDSENKFVYAKPDPAQSDRSVDKARDQRARPVGEPRHGRRRCRWRWACGFPKCVWLVETAVTVERRKSKVESRKSGVGTWAYHPAAFGKWTRSSPGGAEMAVYDVNGDGLNDVVTSLQAHGLGLSWFEQKKAADGSRSFVEHPIMSDFSTKNAGGVIFSQLHGATYADVDGDGLQDFITGKRFWSHLDTFIDPDPHGPPVLYVYRTVRNPKAPGGAEFVPELIHNRSGVGSHLAVVDLDKNGSAEIITSTKRGTYIFWNNWKRPSDNMRLLRATVFVVAAAAIVRAREAER